eukprot:6197799-Pleurochrysis_carterae.AAC.3
MEMNLQGVRCGRGRGCGRGSTRDGDNCPENVNRSVLLWGGMHQEAAPRRQRLSSNALALSILPVRLPGISQPPAPLCQSQPHPPNSYMGAM